jgi:hypothetical protein
MSDRTIVCRLTVTVFFLVLSCIASAQTASVRVNQVGYAS